ncbi:uncharacterized protein LOC102804077 [Saccoglossus kowalevskii]|uniref:WD repeat-containing protein 25-like n=1 Tax=Saccoglossus kowalevskii TaxID=10224 RepID=A0ABM0M0W9_SACKO|nr:PREDICTED: WD repeat-containing protein 25-like [Saccoglossus kowalevskii]
MCQMIGKRRMAIPLSVKQDIPRLILVLIMGPIITIVIILPTCTKDLLSLILVLIVPTVIIQTGMYQRPPPPHLGTHNPHSDNSASIYQRPPPPHTGSHNPHSNNSTHMYQRPPPPHTGTRRPHSDNSSIMHQTPSPAHTNTDHSHSDISTNMYQRPPPPNHHPHNDNSTSMHRTPPPPHTDSHRLHSDNSSDMYQAHEYSTYPENARTRDQNRFSSNYARDSSTPSTHEHQKNVQQTFHEMSPQHQRHHRETNRPPPSLLSLQLPPNVGQQRKDSFAPGKHQAYPPELKRPPRFSQPSYHARQSVSDKATTHQPSIPIHRLPSDNLPKPAASNMSPELKRSRLLKPDYLYEAGQRQISPPDFRRDYHSEPSNTTPEMNRPRLLQPDYLKASGHSQTLSPDYRRGPGLLQPQHLHKSHNTVEQPQQTFKKRVRQSRWCPVESNPQTDNPERNVEDNWKHDGNISQSLGPPANFELKPYVPKRFQDSGEQNNGKAVDVGTTDNAREKNDADTLLPSLTLKTPIVVIAAINEGVVDRLPVKQAINLAGHTSAVNHIKWNVSQYSHLLASASMDKKVKIWDVITDKKCVQTLSFHTAGIKDISWNHSGKQLISCGFDKNARLCDVETGQELECFNHPSYVTCIRYHPQEPNVFISGIYDSAILCWDIRSKKIIRDYRGQFGQILDLQFMSGGSEFLCSTDVVSRDSSDRTIIAWDFQSGAVLSNQIYHEKYTCPCLRVHPCDNSFIAQSNGDYIAYFSTIRPYKMNKNKRSEGHKVSGYQIGCDFSPNGKMIVSGSSDGKVYFYDNKTGRQAHQMECHKEACTDVAYHHTISGMVATCSWDGSVSVLQ